MSDNRIRVFFYGLFMDEALLASKGVDASEPATGYVNGYRLCIGERATLVPEADSRAYGVVMSMTPEDAASLYAEASVADYVAESVNVTLPGEVEITAECYNLPQDKLAGTNPAYAAALLELAIRLGLPDSYLDEIRQAGR